MHSHASGQTLVEVIVALVIATIIIVAITTMISSSFTNADLSENQVNASSLAQQGIDYIRNLHDSDYATFSALVGKSEYLKADNTYVDASTTPIPLIQVNQYAYQRLISIADGSGNNCGDFAATVKVSWSDSKCPSATPFCHNSTLETCISNTNIAPTL